MRFFFQAVQCSSPARCLGAALLFIALALSPLAAGASEAGSFVRGKQERLVSLLKQPASPEQARSIEALFDQLLDYDALAQESLKEHWGELGEAERKEFTDTLRKLVRNAYRRDLRRTLGYQVAFRPEQQAPAGTIVKTVATSRGESRRESISIDYVLHQVDGAWRVKDIITEGSSLVRNYRQQFNRIVKKHGFAELLKRMQGKLAEG